MSVAVFISGTTTLFTTNNKLRRVLAKMSILAVCVRSSVFLVWVWSRGVEGVVPGHSASTARSVWSSL